MQMTQSQETDTNPLFIMNIFLMLVVAELALV